jgi:hypothetical protein
MFEGFKSKNGLYKITLKDRESLLLLFLSLFLIPFSLVPFYFNYVIGILIFIIGIVLFLKFLHLAKRNQKKIDPYIILSMISNIFLVINAYFVFIFTPLKKNTVEAFVFFSILILNIGIIIFIIIGLILRAHLDYKKNNP